MAVIEVPIGPPYGNIPVNTRAIYVARPNASSLTVTDLRIDSAGARAIEVILEIERVGPMLGPDFVRFLIADQANSVCFVNGGLWVSIVPHPTPTQVRQALGA